jgi:hypothetical protein
VSIPIAIALSSNSTPSLRLSVPARGSSSKSLGSVSGNASDVACDRGRSVTGGRRAAVGRWRARCGVTGRDAVGAPVLLEGVAGVVAGEVWTWTIRGVVSAGADDTTTGRRTAGAVGIDTCGLTSACGAGSGDG